LCNAKWSQGTIPPITCYCAETYFNTPNVTVTIVHETNIKIFVVPHKQNTLVQSQYVAVSQTSDDRRMDTQRTIAIVLLPFIILPPTLPIVLCALAAIVSGIFPSFTALIFSLIKLGIVFASFIQSFADGVETTATVLSGFPQH
jgi:hypothetical protein